MRLLTQSIEEKTNKLFNLSRRELMAFFKIMTMFAHPLHSVVPGNQDGTGRCSSLWSPHSLHGHCRNPVCKRLNTYREISHMHIIDILESVNVSMKQNKVCFTSVADSSFLFFAIRIVPFGRVVCPLDVYLHTVVAFD